MAFIGLAGAVVLSIAIVGRSPIGDEHEHEASINRTRTMRNNPFQYSFHKSDEGLRLAGYAIMCEKIQQHQPAIGRGPL